MATSLCFGFPIIFSLLIQFIYVNLYPNFDFFYSWVSINNGPSRNVNGYFCSLTWHNVLLSVLKFLKVFEQFHFSLALTNYVANLLLKLGKVSKKSGRR